VGANVKSLEAAEKSSKIISRVKSAEIAFPATYEKSIRPNIFKLLFLDFGTFQLTSIKFFQV
jgi:hypothetical protein